NKGLSILNEFATTMGAAFEASKDTISAWGESFMSTLDLAGKVMRNFGLYAQIGWLKFMEGAANALSFVETIPPNMVILGEYLRDNWIKVLYDIYKASRVISDNIDKNFINLFHSLQDFFAGKGWNFQWTGLLEGFK